jgi:hypothetical protein
VATGDTIPELDLSDASTASWQLPLEIYGEPIDSIYLYNKAAPLRANIDETLFVP